MMNEERAYEIGATLAKVAHQTESLTICIDRMTDRLCVLQIAVMTLAQKAGVDSLELMKGAQHVYDVERLNRKMDEQ